MMVVVAVTSLALSGCAALTKKGVENQYSEIDSYPMKVVVKNSEQDENNKFIKNLKAKLVENNVIKYDDNIAFVQLPAGFMDKMIAWVIIVPSNLKLGKGDIVIARHPGLKRLSEIYNAMEISSKEQIGSYISFVCSKDDGDCLAKNSKLGAIMLDGSISRGKTCIYALCN